MDKSETIYCAGGCKRYVADQKDAELKGWDFLPITRRWRCSTCQAVNKPK